VPQSAFQLGQLCVTIGAFQQRSELVATHRNFCILLRCVLRRFMEPVDSDRLALFQAFRQLYDIRSKIAQGARFAGGSNELQKLAAAKQEGPILLRQLMGMVIGGAGPRDLTGDDPQRYWRAIELGT
jgi:hypothetical protein